MRWILSACIIPVLVAGAAAGIFGTVRGLIHDPEHRPVQGAQVTLRAVDKPWSRQTSSDGSGEFSFDNVAIGDYQITVDVPGFASQAETVHVTSGRDVRTHFSLALAQNKETVEVNEQSPSVNPESSSATAVISRSQIEATPGAEQANSVAMITSYTPGAYVVHDQLHIRGGHQVSWLLDGIPVPNTNIASNVGPQFDPKDIDSLEIERGGYSAEYGDRTYGVFNVVTRSGFERNRQAELVAGYGSFNNTNDQISFGDHSERFAYYARLNGNRTDLGLETPVENAIHDQASGLSAFTSLIFNKTPNDQLRLVASVRGDHYQIPNDPLQQAAGVADVENERDAFANFSWLRTIGTGTVLTISPFYHFNRAHYIGQFFGNPGEDGVVPEDDRGSNYAGGVTTLSVVRGKHNLRTGIQAFGERDNQFLALRPEGGGGEGPALRQIQAGLVAALFVEDQYRITNWLTLNGGVRLTHFEGSISENAADPRVGAALRIPRLGWVARAFYGRYYQAPPLQTVSGPLLDLAAQQGFGFLPLRGERDEQREFGLAIPLRGWTIDLSNFRTAARNFFDHDALGNSNIFFPLTLSGARVRGWEASVTSPRIAGHLEAHAVYSHQYVEGRGGVSGGLTDFTPPENNAFYLLDHDQRNTLSGGWRLSLPWRSSADFTLNYGSGFLNEDGPAHLPAHTTVDLALQKSFGENWLVRVTGLNIGNQRYLLDNSNTFGGTHWANPREISVQLRFKFHY